MITSPPLSVLKRTAVLRILYCLILLPLAALFGLGLFASATEKAPDITTSSVFGGLVAAIVLLFVWLFRRETRLRIRLHEEGIVAVNGGGGRELRWDEVQEIWFRAIRISAGGLVGGAIGAAVEAASSRAPGALNEGTTSITARIVGGGGGITLTSNYRGVVAAVEEVLRRVNPRLVADCQRRLEEGQTVIFGKVALSHSGVRFGRGKPVPLGEVERLAIEKGRLCLKRRGAWLSRGIPIHKIPNVLVLAETFDRLRGRVSTRPGVSGALASTQ
jgi:hypothetical protein